MLPGKVYRAIQALLTTTGIKTYPIDDTPPFDQDKNYEGFISWDIEEITFMHSTEGLEYTGVAALVTNFELTVICYDRKRSDRVGLTTSVMNVLNPIVAGRRKPLQSVNLALAFVRHVVHVSTTEFPVQKTGQSTPEMSASVLTFNCSFSFTE